ncbi:MAG: DUF366 family protein [Actinomycetota bacterium]
MITKLIPEEYIYDGTQLSSRFIAKVAELPGDACVSFFGPADVPTDNLVDKEDRLAGATIKSARMVHFLIRMEGRSLETAVAFQRLIMAGVLENLIKITDQAGWAREGDDIYLTDKTGKRKLSVSIATTGGAGDCFIHIGVNVISEGAPIPAIGLADLGVNERAFADGVLALVDRELSGLLHAAAKVRPVK